MKKILILGGYTHMIDVVEKAKEMGLYTIVVDRESGSPAKAVADKSYDASTADIDLLADIGRAEGISGVINGFDDINTWNALALCEKLGLPFYATEEQLAICSDKERFKAHCRNYGVPVIEEFEVGGQLEDKDISRIAFPVIVKPVDSYASQGITVCYSADELREGHAKAVRYSKSGKAIIERFIDNAYGVMMFYTVSNGQVVLSATTDRYVHKHYKEHPPLPTATIFPSRHQDLYIQTLDADIRSMIRGMGIQNGVLFIQSLFEDGQYYLYEMGFRLSGTQYYSIVEKQTGINLLELMIDFAIGGDLGRYDIAKFDFGYTKFPACNLSILLDAGTIRQVVGLEKIKEHPAVVAYIPVHEAGDKVELTGTYAQMLGRFNIVAADQTEFMELIKDINCSLHVLSTEGEEMIIGHYNPAELESLTS